MQGDPLVRPVRMSSGSGLIAWVVMPMIVRQTVVEAASPHLGGRIDRVVQELAGGSRSHVTGCSTPAA